MEQVPDTAKIVIRAELARNSFSFGRDLPYDALTAAIIVLQILASL